MRPSHTFFFVVFCRIAIAPAAFASPLDPSITHVAPPDPAVQVQLSALSVELGATRPYGADAYRKLFLVMWAQVPNWKSGDPLWIKRAEPAWVPPPRELGKPRARRPPPHEPEKLDWIEALSHVDLGEIEQPFAFEGLPKIELPPVPAEDRGPLRADALRVLTAMHALAATHRAEAVAPIFRLAFVLDGVFRDECGRQIRAIGDAAVAPLVTLQYERGPPNAPLAKQRRYAVYQLDRMDRARPSKAIATAPDDRLRAELIHVYGEVRAPDAVEAVLEQVNAQSHAVRREARWAFRRYVEGPPPPPAPKRKRRLPGGKEESEEKPDYLTYREVAELALQRRVADEDIALADPHASALAMFEAIVAKDEAERAAEWERTFVAARQKADAGDVTAAIDEYEWILAHDPTTPRRVEMAPAFARAADERRRAGKLDEAAGLYWKASALAVPETEARRLEAEANFTDAERARAAGRHDEAALHRTLALAPSHEGARAALAKFEGDRSRRRREQETSTIAAIGALLLVGSWLLLRPRRRRT